MTPISNQLIHPSFVLCHLINTIISCYALISFPASFQYYLSLYKQFDQTFHPPNYPFLCHGILKQVKAFAKHYLCFFFFSFSFFDYFSSSVGSLFACIALVLKLVVSVDFVFTFPSLSSQFMWCKVFNGVFSR